MNEYRDELEASAKSACPANMWYELLDSIEETSNEDLERLIKNETAE